MLLLSITFSIYRSSPEQSIWASGTHGRGIPPYYAILQSDGNFAVYDGNENKLWQTGTKEEKYTSLIMQDDGNLVLYKDPVAPIPIWATNTQQNSGESSHYFLNLLLD